jgi:hypothetical protein
MIVDDLDVLRARGRPTKADAELIIHANAVLPSTIAPQRFQTIARRHAKVPKLCRDLQLSQLASGNRLNVRKSLNPPPFRQSRCLGTPERKDHYPI